MKLTTSEKIKLLAKRKMHNPSNLADKMKVSRQNLSQKLIRGNFRESELREIAEALDCELIIEFKEK